MERELNTRRFKDVAKMLFYHLDVETTYRQRHFNVRCRMKLLTKSVSSTIICVSSRFSIFAVFLYLNTTTQGM